MTDILTPVDIEAIAAANGRTMAEVCRNAGIAPSTFSRWKSGKTAPSIDVYSRIKDAAAQKTSEPVASGSAP